ncbi:HlyC/CorC family transporter [Paracoccus suum]|uniref:HlyC/CorC family transporter n=1 Tax=Paracoccus suum TaxID=2259340 RepID=A0A344PNP4_9RHOB|nr:hemolysin family protein [Paracoccus suum]AXC50999.1 HlyC/CorC family transporter [Paracoccus suum]
MLIEILAVLLLTVVNGVLSMSELAVVSARTARLKVMADNGNRGAATAIELADDPGKFLSSVQIGITLVGILAGAVSGATLGNRLANALVGAGLTPGVAQPLGVGVVVVLITYLSLVVGELVPKQIALRAPETVAARVAPWLRRLAVVVSPLVWLLDHSGKSLLRLLGLSEASENSVSDEEVKMIISEAESAGVMKPAETEMIAAVMRVADRTARGIMTPRHEVSVLPSDASFEQAVLAFADSGTSRLPVADARGEIEGVVSLSTILAQRQAGAPFDLVAAMEQVEVIREGMGALEVLERLRAAPTRMLFVYDEYGHFEGMVTPMDLLEAITGEFADGEVEEPKVTTRADGSLLVAGWMPADELADQLRITLQTPRDYETVAGLVLDRMGRLPEVGDTAEIGPWQIEVMDMDGRRIDKVLVTRIE